MAVVFPVLLALVIGTLEMARLGMVVQLMTTAARDGCRVAVLSNATAAQVQARVNAVLAGSGISVGAVTPSPAGWATAKPGDPITVSLSVPFSSVSWLPTPWFLKGATVKASATLASEKVAWLP
jgi:Flp pilus assembly protein TadG